MKNPNAGQKKSNNARNAAPKPTALRRTRRLNPRTPKPQTPTRILIPVKDVEPQCDRLIHHQRSTKSRLKPLKAPAVVVEKTLKSPKPGRLHTSRNIVMNKKQIRLVHAV